MRFIVSFNTNFVQGYLVTRFPVTVSKFKKDARKYKSFYDATVAGKHAASIIREQHRIHTKFKIERIA